MLLTNKRYTVRITVEDEKQFNSAVYDFVYDPLTQKIEDLPKIFSLDIHDGFQTRRIALIADVLCVETHCAVLEDHVLTVLLNKEIVQLHLEDGRLICCKAVDSFGCNWEIHPTKPGFVIYGELEITMLDRSLQKQWSVSGNDIFASLTKGSFFEVTEETIQVYDFDDTFYEFDLNGVLLKEIPAKKQLESDAEEAAPI